MLVKWAVPVASSYRPYNHIELGPIPIESAISLD